MKEGEKQINKNEERVSEVSDDFQAFFQGDFSN